MITMKMQELSEIRNSERFLIYINIYKYSFHQIYNQIDFYKNEKDLQKNFDLFYIFSYVKNKMMEILLDCSCQTTTRLT